MKTEKKLLRDSRIASLLSSAVFLANGRMTGKPKVKSVTHCKQHVTVSAVRKNDIAVLLK